MHGPVNVKHKYSVKIWNLTPTCNFVLFNGLVTGLTMV